MTAGGEASSCGLGEASRGLLERQPAVDGAPLGALVACDLARLLRLVEDEGEAEVRLLLLGRHSLEGWVVIEVSNLPLVQLLYVSHHVQLCPGLENVRELCQRIAVDDPPAVVFCLSIGPTSLRVTKGARGSACRGVGSAVFWGRQGP
jgi:hypothetical protein